MDTKTGEILIRPGLEDVGEYRLKLTIKEGNKFYTKQMFLRVPVPE